MKPGSWTYLPSRWAVVADNMEPVCAMVADHDVGALLAAAPDLLAALRGLLASDGTEDFDASEAVWSAARDAVARAEVTR